MSLSVFTEILLYLNVYYFFTCRLTKCPYLYISNNNNKNTQNENRSKKS